MKEFPPRLEVLPPAQRELWPLLAPIQRFGYVLYGGTAIALRLAHRYSVDFDFFTSQSVNPGELRKHLPFLRDSRPIQEHHNTFEVATFSGVKVSFFGGLDFGRVGTPDQTSDGITTVASLDDLMATKLKVILQRSELKDYQDIAAMSRAGVRVDAGLAAAEEMFRPTFSPLHSLKALVYFDDGDLSRLSAEDRRTLVTVAQQVRSLPPIKRTLRLDAMPEARQPLQEPKTPGPEMEF